MGPEDPRPGSDFESFRAARDRFFARVRPEAMTDPPESLCPEVVPAAWPSRPGDIEAAGEDPTPAT